jgi:hypothetical protein
MQTLIKTLDGKRFRAEDVELVQVNGGFDKISVYRFFDMAKQLQNEVRYIDVESITPLMPIIN